MQLKNHLRNLKEIEKKIKKEKEEAEIARKKAKEAEEAARKAEAARKKAEEEAEAARKKAEEEAEAARKKAEEEARKAEEAAKKAEEEAEAARKKAEEAARKAEEEEKEARKIRNKGLLKSSLLLAKNLEEMKIRRTGDTRIGINDQDHAQIEFEGKKYNNVLFYAGKESGKSSKILYVSKKNNEYLGYYNDNVSKFLEPQQNEELVKLIKNNKCIVKVNGKFVLPQNMKNDTYGKIYMLVDENDQNIVKKPKNSDWEKIYDENSGRFYFYNKKTKESRWKLPKNLVKK